MSFPPIHSLVPHADPMVLLERVVAVDEVSLSAELTISRDSLFFDDNAAGVGAWWVSNIWRRR